MHSSLHRQAPVLDQVRAMRGSCADQLYLKAFKLMGFTHLPANSLHDTADAWGRHAASSARARAAQPPNLLAILGSSVYKPVIGACFGLVACRTYLYSTISQFRKTRAAATRRLVSEPLEHVHCAA
jgi:hypothetical protein